MHVGSQESCGRIILTTLFLFLIVNVNTQQTNQKCPIGFTAVSTINNDEIFCIKQKGPEPFADKFVDCADNLFTSKLYKKLDFNKPKINIWADYKTVYAGGPFIDWSYTESTGDVLTTTFDVEYDLELGLDEELCTVITATNNLTAVNCNEQHYRYCAVAAYDDIDDMTNEGCDNLENFNRFWSPRPTCLSFMTGVKGGNVRATWRQSADICLKHGSKLLHHGWLYANHPLLHLYKKTTIENSMVPLGIVMTSDEKMMWIDGEDDDNNVPDSEWNFKDETFEPDGTLVALQSVYWKLVNSSFVFYDVICERSIPLKNVSLNISYVNSDTLELTTSDSGVDVNKIWCFTDSVIFYPSEVKIDRIDNNNNFQLKPSTDGYYWCIHADTKNYRVSESEKKLFIRETNTVTDLYAIKIKVQKKYNLENLEKLLKIWSRKLSAYIHLTTKLKKQKANVQKMDIDSSEEELYFKDQSEDKGNLLNFMRLKRVYLDGQTVLLHAHLNSGIDHVHPGYWEDLEIQFVKPAYYCKALKNVPSLSLGETQTIGCKTYSCVGDFNEGVQWVETLGEGCNTTTTSVTASTSIELQTESVAGDEVVDLKNSRIVALKSDPELEDITTEADDSITAVSITNATESETPLVVDENQGESASTYRPTRPTTTTSTTAITTTTVRCNYEPTTTVPEIEAEEQLQNVINNLQNILNSTQPISLQEVETAFDEVNILLDLDGDVEIPGEFLNLLDELGSRANLNGTTSATTVRHNIALMVADAGPDSPYRGIRIASREDDGFTEDAFQFLSDTPNTTELTANSTEVLVNLPSSTTDSDRRMSFVVFRNDRPFYTTPERVNTFSVNSRVLSIKVENVTQFNSNEFVEIHFRPINNTINENLYRACAFWEFFEDGSGHWSTDGCTYIVSTDPDLLNSCRCNHLTHFAEILVPFTNFSSSHEKALEIISLVACSISMIGVILIGLTAVLFRSWRKDFNNKIWLQLCIAILILHTVFIVVVFSDFQDQIIPCMLVGILLHYSVLASFCWMLVAAIISYRRLVLVFTRDTSHKLLKASAFAWGVPCAIVGILLSVDPRAYGSKFQNDTSNPAADFCYPSGLGLWLSVYTPIAVMLVANWTLFALIVRSVFASRRIQRHGDSKEALRCATVSCLLVFLFGLPWIFGLFAYNIVAAYLFTLTATFQGFVLFVFFVIGNKKTRDLWMNKLKIKQTRNVPVTSSTYKSTGGWKGTSAKTAIGEANISKPRSLASSDDSRFS